jgi:hypothetical protein
VSEKRCETCKELRREIEYLVSCVMSVRESNTREWMDYIEEKSNRAMAIAGCNDRIVWHRDHFECVLPMKPRDEKEPK